jgi:hypothetical protein
MTPTIENPANRSLTNRDILIGSSKSPSVTAFTARRDYERFQHIYTGDSQNQRMSEYREQVFTAEATHIYNNYREWSA